MRSHSAPDIKFCGLTRAEDAAHAARAGARYVGAIFAGGPRALSPEQAGDVLGAAGPDVERVGVFGAVGTHPIARTAQRANLDVVQLHGDPTAADVEAVRRATRCRVWGVVRMDGPALPSHVRALFDAADAVLFDSRVAGRLGGSGVTVDWQLLARLLAPIRAGHVIVLAGGLTPHNVRDAVAALRPDVVDVSSGVERAPGIKDHALMTAFAEAVWAAA